MIFNDQENSWFEFFFCIEVTIYILVILLYKRVVIIIDLNVLLIFAIYKIIGN